MTTSPEPAEASATRRASAAVYVPLPNGLHAEWTLKALEVGKHVLCEKPFTANAAEARRVAEASAGSGLVVMEAFHYRYHPLAERMKQFVDSGVLGEIRHIESTMCIPLPMKNDIRYNYELAGGATMDVGSYAIHQLRFLAGAEPEVIAATARLAQPYVDRWMQADFRFPDGRTGRMTCALLSARLFDLSIRVSGTDGHLHVFNPTGPQFFSRLRVKSKSRVATERVRGEATSTTSSGGVSWKTVRREPARTTATSGTRCWNLLMLTPTPASTTRSEAVSYTHLTLPTICSV